MKLDSILLMFIGGMSIAILFTYGPIACFAVGLAFAAGVVMDQEDKNK